MLREEYKFTLAFENSLCTDYVTDKLYTALESGVVPVVYGEADYRAYAPANSYINARDFESPRQLAEYRARLQSLQANVHTLQLEVVKAAEIEARYPKVLRRVAWRSSRTRIRSMVARSTTRSRRRWHAPSSAWATRRCA